MKLKILAGLAALVMILTAGTARAQVRITEWMYNGATPVTSIGEFVELTNLGPAAVPTANWSFDDSSRAPGSQSLAGFVQIDPGESVILTDMTAAQFRTAWGLPASVKVVGGNTNNLGRADEINIYSGPNGVTDLVDRLTYDDQDGSGPRTQFRSGNPLSLAVLGANNDGQWVLSTNGDTYGSHIATTTDVGNPGLFSLPVPEPSTFVLAGIGLVAAGWQAFRRRRTNIS